jgi:hypothetical protein
MLDDRQLRKSVQVVAIRNTHVVCVTRHRASLEALLIGVINTGARGIRHACEM